jgi:hypothetical protein
VQLTAAESRVHEPRSINPGGGTAALSVMTSHNNLQVKGQQEALNPHIEELHEKISGLQARSDAEKAALARQLELRECRVAHLQTVQADFFRARLGLRFDRSVPHGAWRRAHPGRGRGGSIG